MNRFLFGDKTEEQDADRQRTTMELKKLTQKQPRTVLLLTLKMAAEKKGGVIQS